MNLEEHTTEIVASLGGIDTILTEYIRISQKYDDEELLTEKQIKQITKSVSRNYDTVGVFAKITDSAPVGNAKSVENDKGMSS